MLNPLGDALHLVPNQNLFKIVWSFNIELFFASSHKAIRSRNCNALSLKLSKWCLNLEPIKRSFTYCPILSQRQILGTGNLLQDSAPVCIIIDISPEMAAQSAQRNQAFCVTASHWSPITSA